jgi:hypothetical protein
VTRATETDETRIHTFGGRVLSLNGADHESATAAAETVPGNAGGRVERQGSEAPGRGGRDHAAAASRRVGGRRGAGDGDGDGEGGGHGEVGNRRRERVERGRVTSWSRKWVGGTRRVAFDVVLEGDDWLVRGWNERRGNADPVSVCGARAISLSLC